MTQQFPAGWYPQPDGGQRFWDGLQWTNEVRVGGPTSDSLQAGGPKPSKPWYKKKRFIIPAVAVLAIIAIPKGSSSQIAAVPDATTSAAVATGASTSVQTAAQAPISAPAPTKAATTQPAKAPASSSAVVTTKAPVMTTSQQQAIRSAKSYLDYSGFSRKGLIKQLEFEGFSTADATFGVDQSGANWMQQAERVAKSYLDYSSFSRKSLIAQLVFEGFTSEQAAHGADFVGL